MPFPSAVVGPDPKPGCRRVDRGNRQRAATRDWRDSARAPTGCRRRRITDGVATSRGDAVNFHRRRTHRLERVRRAVADLVARVLQRVVRESAPAARGGARGPPGSARARRRFISENTPDLRCGAAMEVRTRRRNPALRTAAGTARVGAHDGVGNVVAQSRVIPRVASREPRGRRTGRIGIPARSGAADGRNAEDCRDRKRVRAGVRRMSFARRGARRQSPPASLFALPRKHPLRPRRTPFAVAAKGSG